MRFKDIRTYRTAVADIVAFMDANPLINYRYLVMPSKELVSNTLYMLDFYPANECPMIE
jgi:hypothetical protein